MVQSSLNNVVSSKNIAFIVHLTLLVLSCTVELTEQRKLKHVKNIPEHAAKMVGHVQTTSHGATEDWSPGVGHFETTSSPDSTDKWSPGVGHHVTTHAGDLSRTASAGDVVEDNAPEDFRPTTPGHSPGAGHSIGPIGPNSQGPYP